MVIPFHSIPYKQFTINWCTYFPAGGVHREKKNIQALSFLIVAYGYETSQWTLLQMMAWYLWGAKPYPEPMLSYCQLDPNEHFFNEIHLKFKSFYPRNCIWKCRPQDGIHVFKLLWGVIWGLHLGLLQGHLVRPILFVLTGCRRWCMGSIDRPRGAC